MVQKLLHGKAKEKIYALGAMLTENASFARNEDGYESGWIQYEMKCIDMKYQIPCSVL